VTEKHNPNPFIRMAQEAKEKKLEQAKINQLKTGDTPKKVQMPLKQNGNFGQKVMRKTGRGG
jgi:hypothetical protein